MAVVPAAIYRLRTCPSSPGLRLVVLRDPVLVNGTLGSNPIRYWYACEDSQRKAHGPTIHRCDPKIIVQFCVLLGNKFSFEGSLISLSRNVIEAAVV